MAGLVGACLVGAVIAYPLTGLPGIGGRDAAAELIRLPANTPSRRG
ncbi:hypothetical protein [Nonomuraea sp. NPDC003214]